LAADGAKEALWLLFKEKIRTVNFIHDETINENNAISNIDLKYGFVLEVLE
jgi:hypothetical protein